MFKDAARDTGKRHTTRLASLWIAHQFVALVVEQSVVRRKRGVGFIYQNILHAGIVESLARNGGNLLCQRDRLQLIATLECLVANSGHALGDAKLLQVFHIVEGGTCCSGTSLRGIRHFFDVAKLGDATEEGKLVESDNLFGLLLTVADGNVQLVLIDLAQFAERQTLVAVAIEIGLAECTGMLVVEGHTGFEVVGNDDGRRDVGLPQGALQHAFAFLQRGNGHHVVVNLNHLLVVSLEGSSIAQLHLSLHTVKSVVTIRQERQRQQASPVVAGKTLQYGEIALF